MSDGTITIDTLLDQSGLKKGLSSLNSVVKTGIKSSVTAITAVGAALAGVGTKCVDFASDLTEVQNVVDTTFGDSANKINQWAKDANKAFGLNELQAKQYVSTLGAMAKSSGITGEALDEMSTSLAGLSADFASFYNLSNDEAFEKIRAGISGEARILVAY